MFYSLWYYRVNKLFFNFKKINYYFCKLKKKSKNTFDHIPKWINDMKEYGNEHVNIILIGNKCDLED